MRFAITAPLILASLLLQPAAAPAQMPPQAFEKTVTFNFINSNLLTAVVQMERQCHVQCILRDGIDVQRPVNLNMTGMPLSQALRFLASVAGAQIARNAEGVYVFTPSAPAMSYNPRFSLPPTHFNNSFEGGGFNGSDQQPLIVFPHTVPAGASIMEAGPPEIDRAKSDLSDQPRRIYALD